MKKMRRRLSTKLQTRRKFIATPAHVLKVGRNEPCPCGSGNKYKNCHESQGESFLRKIAKQKEKERLKESRNSPWWKRFFGR